MEYKIISTDGLLIKTWTDDLVGDALEQAKNLAVLPFAFKHIAIMPDAHLGYGMPIGGVLATKDVVIPNAVGVDIGCGVCAIKTSLTNIATDRLKEIMGKIRTKIPVGFNKHKKRQEQYERSMPDLPVILPIVIEHYDNALKSIGTLGGGNHFIEFQKGKDKHIWIMIHSGSRNLGLQVAKHYNNIAKELNAKWHSVVPKEHDLAFLPAQSEESLAYLREMDFCVEFAKLNREVMMDKILETLNETFPKFNIEYDAIINIPHNYVAIENHFGQNVYIHRKGATKAYEGQLGIIPGSQGTKSYIVKGKGELMSFKSCSHGAGREMGRKQAKRELNLEAEKKILDDQGIIHGMRNLDDLDEAPSAYKNIDVVMENQKDLVQIVEELKPIAVIKG